MPDYSARRASIGLMRAARRAGSQHATNATAMIRRVVPDQDRKAFELHTRARGGQEMGKPRERRASVFLSKNDNLGDSNVGRVWAVGP
ncbi:MAG: hypothetical protein WCE51_13900 [Chthoniobacterales bacterium]